MRTFLVVIDKSAEAELALRFAARRAAQGDGQLVVLAIIPPQDFVAFGSIQATIEAEARDEAAQLLERATALAKQELGRDPIALVRSGKPADVVRTLLTEHQIAALVLGAAAHAAPGPLVDHFTGPDCGKLSCIVMIVPGAMSIDQLDDLS